MKKKILNTALSTVFLIGLTGCFETNIKKNETGVSSNKSFSISIPNSRKENGRKFSGAGEAISVISGIDVYEGSNTSLSYISVFSFKADNSSFASLRYKCLYSEHLNVNKKQVELGESANCNQFSKQVIKLSGSLTMKRLPKSMLIGIIPKNKQFASNKNFHLSLTTNDLRKRFLEARFPFQFAVNSKYSTESTYANFARTLRKSSYNKGEKDPVTGKIFNDGFIINIGGKSISIRVETFPYRNGSKAVVYALIPPQNKGNLVDFYEVSEKLKTKVRALVHL